MGNPNYRQPKVAPIPIPIAKKPETPKRLERRRRLGNYWGKGPVLKVALGSVENRWEIGKLWEDAQWDPSADITKICFTIQKQIQDALDAQTRWRKDNDGLLWKLPEASKIKLVWLSDTGLTIYFYDFQTRERLAWKFEKWTAKLMPGATILNARDIRRPKVCGMLVNINKEKLNNDPRKRESYGIFEKNNPAVKYPSGARIPYRVIDMEEVFSESSWLITLSSPWAMEVLYREPLNFFGVKTCGVELVSRGGDSVPTGPGCRKVNP